MPFLIVSAIVCAGLAGPMARNRGLDPTTWTIVCFLFGWIALIVLWIIPPRPAAPKGMVAATCPRCNAVQNVPQSDLFYECWQCHLSAPVR